MLIRVATRGSALARWQASRVADLLRTEQPGISIEFVVVETMADRRLDVALTDLGGQGVFVKEVQAAVLDGRADIAVHSAKDLPSATAPGLLLACIPEREDPSDALVGSTLAGIPPGGLIATGSVRRRAQLAWLRPDLRFTGLRGNIATRLAQARPDQVVVVAAAALRRLDLMERASEVLPADVMLPQVAQGALAVECRADDDAVIAMLATIEDRHAHRTVAAERGFLARLGGGCDLPVGALAVGSGEAITVDGLIASPDGRFLLRSQRSGGLDEDPASIGAALAGSLLDEAARRDLLDANGGIR